MNKRYDNYVINIFDVLTLIFVVLKLCKVIEWSWIWVLSPLWINTILYLFLLIIIYLIYK